MPCNVKFSVYLINVAPAPNCTQFVKIKHATIKIINTLSDFQIVPEIELPGHSTAAVNAMRIRHNRNSNNPDYSKLLTDFILQSTMMNLAIQLSTV